MAFFCWYVSVLSLYSRFPVFIIGRYGCRDKTVALGWRRTVEHMISKGALTRPWKEVVQRPSELSVFRQAATSGREEIQKLLDWLAEELGRF